MSKLSKQSGTEEIAIMVTNVSKAFKLPHEKRSSIKGLFLSMFSGKRTFERQQVLEDISFDIKKGEFIGIVGRNGSGKSTLLKMLSGIYTPDKGRIEVNGKLTPFIELGVGFNPELTGRENVFLNGALLGFNRVEMTSMYDEIVEFAELEKFMDQKLKNYSSGMQVRLAFAIAIRANTDVLVLDEVLAVGDSNFQRKCFDYFNQLKKDKKTIVLVTHDMTAVERFCDRAILINNGKLIMDGKPNKITQEYSNINLELTSKKIKKNKQQAVLEGKREIEVEVTATDVMKNRVVVFDALSNPKIKFDISIKAKQNYGKVRVGIIITNSADTPLFATNTSVEKLDVDLQKNKTATLRLAVVNAFANGEHKVTITVRDAEGITILHNAEDIYRFAIGGRKHEYAITSPPYTLSVQ